MKTVSAPLIALLLIFAFQGTLLSAELPSKPNGQPSSAGFKPKQLQSRADAAEEAMLQRQSASDETTNRRAQELTTMDAASNVNGFNFTGYTLNASAGQAIVFSGSRGYRVNFSTGQVQRIVLNSNGTVTYQNTSLSSSSFTSSPSIRFQNDGSNSFSAGSITLVDGTLTIAGATSSTRNNVMVTLTGALSFGSSVTKVRIGIAGPATNRNVVTIHSALNGNFGLQVYSQSTVFSTNIGGTTPLKWVNIQGSAIILRGVRTTGGQSYGPYGNGLTSVIRLRGHLTNTVPNAATIRFTGSVVLDQNVIIRNEITDVSFFGRAIEFNAIQGRAGQKTVADGVSGNYHLDMQTGSFGVARLEGGFLGNGVPGDGDYYGYAINVRTLTFHGSGLHASSITTQGSVNITGHLQLSPSFGDDLSASSTQYYDAYNFAGAVVRTNGYLFAAGSIGLVGSPYQRKDDFVEHHVLTSGGWFRVDGLHTTGIFSDETVLQTPDGSNSVAERLPAFRMALGGGSASIAGNSYIGRFTIENLNNLTVTGELGAESIRQTEGFGTTSFSQPIFTNAGSIDLTGNNFRFNGVRSAGTITIRYRGSVTNSGTYSPTPVLIRRS